MTGLQEGIGISLDLKGGRMFFTDLGGNVYSAGLDGSKLSMSGRVPSASIAAMDSSRV